jgi:hypothetical protein
LPTTVEGQSRDQNVDHGENPDWLFFPSNDRPDLVCLKFHARESVNFSIVESDDTRWLSSQASVKRIAWTSDADLFRPSTLRAETSSKVARLC